MSGNRLGPAEPRPSFGHDWPELQEEPPPRFPTFWISVLVLTGIGMIGWIVLDLRLEDIEGRSGLFVLVVIAMLGLRVLARPRRRQQRRPERRQEDILP
jgi:hypothetical protein